MVRSKDRYRNRIELLQGTLDLLILQTLQWGPQHGYGVSQAIRTNTGEVLQVDTGSLYPALLRLERKGWIASEWRVSENKQRVKVYRLSLSGKKQLASERSRWDQLSAAIAGTLKPVKTLGSHSGVAGGKRTSPRRSGAISRWPRGRARAPAGERPALVGGQRRRGAAGTAGASRPAGAVALEMKVGSA